MSLSVSNIFSVGSDVKPEEAIENELRADLMLAISTFVREKGWDQKEAAAKLGLNQPQVSAVMNWRIEKLTSQRLFKCLSALGVSFKPKYEGGKFGVEVRQVEVAVPV